jgi:hypothetical protein
MRKNTKHSAQELRRKAHRIVQNTNDSVFENRDYLCHLGPTKKVPLDEACRNIVFLKQK